MYGLLLRSLTVIVLPQATLAIELLATDIGLPHVGAYR